MRKKEKKNCLMWSYDRNTAVYISVIKVFKIVGLEGIDCHTPDKSTVQTLVFVI